jgi:hypothetical protein
MRLRFLIRIKLFMTRDRDQELRRFINFSRIDKIKGMFLYNHRFENLSKILAKKLTTFSIPSGAH